MSTNPSEHLSVYACVPLMMWKCYNVCMTSMYLAWSCRMLRSCCSSPAAALESVRQVVGTSATGAFCCCSFGAGRGTGCFCRLDRIRSLAAHRETQSTTLRLVATKTNELSEFTTACLEYQFWLCTIVEAGVVSEAGVWGLQEDWLTLHLFPQRQNLSLIILQTLLVHILEPQFLQQNNDNTTSNLGAT